MVNVTVALGSITVVVLNGMGSVTMQQLVIIESLKRQLRKVFKHNPEVRRVLIEWLNKQTTYDSKCPHCGKDIRGKENEMP